MLVGVVHIHTSLLYWLSINKTIQQQNQQEHQNQKQQQNKV